MKLSVAVEKYSNTITDLYSMTGGRYVGREVKRIELVS